MLQVHVYHENYITVHIISILVQQGVLILGPGIDLDEQNVRVGSRAAKDIDDLFQPVSETGTKRKVFLLVLEILLSRLVLVVFLETNILFEIQKFQRLSGQLHPPHSFTCLTHD